MDSSDSNLELPNFSTAEWEEKIKFELLLRKFSNMTVEEEERRNRENAIKEEEEKRRKEEEERRQLPVVRKLNFGDGKKIHKLLTYINEQSSKVIKILRENSDEMIVYIHMTTYEIGENSLTNLSWKSNRKVKRKIYVQDNSTNGVFRLDFSEQEWSGFSDVNELLLPRVSFNLKRDVFSWLITPTANTSTLMTMVIILSSDMDELKTIYKIN